MIPASYLSPAVATQVLTALKRGSGTGTASSGTAADLGINGWENIPSLRDMPTDLVNRVLSSDLSSSTSTIDTTGLATASITILNNIRTRVVAAMTALYDDQSTPIQSPFYGLTAGTSAYNHMRDAIVHMIFRFDSRYLLRKRSNVGANAENYTYELESSYQLSNYPLILGRLRPHGFTDGSVDDIGTNGQYQILTTAPHGYYTGQTITPTSAGTSIAQKIYPMDNLTQNNPTTQVIEDVTSKFVLDTGTVNSFIDGQPVVTDGQTGWDIFDWQPKRYVKRLSDTEFELHRNAALNDQIIPGWGTIADVHTVTYNGVDTLAVNTYGTHMAFDDIPQILDPDGTSDTTLGIFERKANLSVDPLTGVWSTGDTPGFSIVDGQITNFANMNSAGWQNIHSFYTPLYFKKLTDTTFELYYEESLTTKFYPGTDITDTVNSFSQSGSNWSVNFSSDYPPIVSGQSISFRNTDTNFSNALGISTFTPVALTTPNLDYNVVEYCAGQYIAAGASSAAGTTDNYYYSTDGVKWTLGSWTSPTKIKSIAYNATNNRTVALEENSTYVQTRTGTDSWSQANRQSGGNTSVQKIVTFDLSGTPRFLVAPNLANQSWTYSQTGAAGSWASYSPSRFTGLGYTVLDVTVGGSTNSDVVAVMWTGPSGSIVSTKSTDGGATWGAFTTLVSSISAPVTATMAYANGKYVVLFRDKAYYSTNGTSWTAVTLSTSKTWINLKALNGVFYANANDGSTSSIKSTDGGVNWTTVTLSHGGIEIATYGNGKFVGVKNPTSTPAFVQSLDAISWANYDDATWTTAANHQLENGQPIRFNSGSGTSFDIDGYICVVPRAVWAKTTGLAANEFKLYLDEALTIPWTPWYGETISAKTLTSIIYRMAFYAKRTTATTFALYIDSAMTNPYSQTVSITGFTTGDVVRTGHILSMSPPSAGYIQPMFYCRRDSYFSFSLWTNAARTTPFPFFSKNGVLTSLSSGSSTSIDEVESGNIDLVYTSYPTTGVYRYNNIGYNAAFTAGEYPVAGSIKPVFYTQKLTPTAIQLYIDEARSIPVKSGGTGPNAPAIGSATTATSFEITYFDTYRYRLDTIDCYNIGGVRYYYKDYSGGGDGVTGVNASWALTGYKFYTDHNTSNKIGTYPTTAVFEYSNTNAGAYYGMMRKTKASGADTNTGPATVSTSTYGGVGSPVIFELEYPGQFQTDSQFAFGISPQADVGTPTVDPLDYTGDEWVTDSNVTEDRYDRQWPHHIMPATLTWSIEQPTQVLESQNSTRYVNTKDITQYRIKLSYAPMTMEQFRPFLNVITAARGGYKPFKFFIPKNHKNESVTINVNHRNGYVPSIVRGRTTVAGGQQIIKLDGLPPNLTDAY